MKPAITSEATTRAIPPVLDIIIVIRKNPRCARISHVTLSCWRGVRGAVGKKEFLFPAFTLLSPACFAISSLTRYLTSLVKCVCANCLSFLTESYVFLGPLIDRDGLWTDGEFNGGRFYGNLSSRQNLACPTKPRNGSLHLVELKFITIRH